MEKSTYFENLKNTPNTLVGIWHARGNQGAIGACGILARLVLRAGYDATAFGIFGAEKAGAPIMGFNRISAKPIEAYYAPNKYDFIVIMDPTIAGVTAGSHDNTIYVVNTPKKPEEIARELKLGPTRVIAVDATEIAKKVMPAKAQYPNTAMLGAVIHLFPEITIEMLKEEIREAENFVEKGEKVIAMNISAGELGFVGIKEFDGRDTDVPKAVISPPKIIPWDQFEPAGAIIHTGNSSEKNTGTWRTERPVRMDEVNLAKITAGLTAKKCTDCMLCFHFCPDFSIVIEDGMIHGIDLEHCKGCGICKNVCPFNALAIISEARAKKNDAK